MARARALIIEDNPVDRSYVRFLVKRESHLGLTLDEASNADDAMKLIKQNEYDLVISDHHLQGAVTGLDILNQLGRSQPKCRRMLLTSDTRQEIMTEAFWRSAAERVVRKSAGSREILGNVNELLRE